MRRETLRDFSISPKRKLEHQGGWAGGKGQNLIYFRGVFMIECRFNIPALSVRYYSLDCIRASPQHSLWGTYPSRKQWILRPQSNSCVEVGFDCFLCSVLHTKMTVVLPWKQNGKHSLQSSCEHSDVTKSTDCQGFVSVSRGMVG